jgi:hypothetical protein
MVTDVAIYLEGGGPTAATRTPFRQGMSGFLKPLVELARARKIRWRIVPCGSRNEAFDDFLDALDKEPEVFNVLLVDSEALPATDLPWDHLKSRDNWNKPASAVDRHCHLMTACMESWLVVDREALKKYFGEGFDETKLPLPQYVETSAKKRVSDSLNKATKETTAKGYEKIRDGARLLSRISPAIVRKHCKWCERFFVTLATEMGTTV